MFGELSYQCLLFEGKAFLQLPSHAWAILVDVVQKDPSFPTVPLHTRVRRAGKCLRFRN